MADPRAESPPIGRIAILWHSPVLDDAYLIEIYAEMILKLTLVGRFLYGIDAPIFPVDEHHSLPYGETLKVEVGGNGL